MEEISGIGSTPGEQPKLESEMLEALKEKVNVDQAAIDEAREAVGDDEEKIREYLVNNRGL